MARRIAIAAAIVALTRLNCFQFPGHTYLQADTQVYVPILENLQDPSVLAKDLLVQKPHVSFTLYDEMARGLRNISGMPLRDVLTGAQIVCRGLGIWGLYLIASSAGLSTGASLLVAAIVSLGATISGPAVLTFEYEPTPRGLAVPLLFLGIGLVAHGRYTGGAIAGSVAFLLHAPSVYPFWSVYAVLALRRRSLQAFAPLIAAGILLWIASRAQGGAEQAGTFFTTLDAAQESLQRMRASYNWVSIWGRQWAPHYIFLCAIAMLAVARLWKLLGPDLRFFAIGLPMVGVASMAFSYVGLEKMKLALLPQFQPMRALLFVTFMAVLLAAIAACVAVWEGRYWEAIPWLALAYLVPANNRVLDLPAWNRILVIFALVGLSIGAIWADKARRNWAPAVLTLAAVSAFFVIPIFGKVNNYAALHSPVLAELCQWARSSTPKGAVFLFPDAKQELEPGVFRAEALRAVYVDWKAGGQVNYFKEFGEQWLSRWQDVMAKPFTAADCARYPGLGIDYIVLKPEHKLAARNPVFENSRFVVYVVR